MSAPPYMKLYVADYLGDTHHLGAMEHGAYLLLLMAMWRAGGNLPAADVSLAKLARCTPDQWAEIRETILPFFRRRGGKLSHKRLSSEMAKYEHTSGKRSEAGKQGGRPKRNENNGEDKAKAYPAESNCRHNQNHNQNHNHNQKEDGGGGVREPAPDDWPEGDAHQHAALLVSAVASPWLDPHKSLGLNTTEGQIAGWRRDGASWAHDVLPIVTALCTGRRDAVSTWKFFNPAIARSIADNRAALDIPLAQPRATGPPDLATRIAAEKAEARRRVLEDG